MIDEVESSCQGFIRNLGEIRTFGEELSQQAIRVFIGAPLPGGIRISEIDLYIMSGFQARIAGKLFTTVSGCRLEGSSRVLGGSYTIGDLHGQGGTIGHPNGGVQASFAFHKCGHAAFAFSTTGDDGIELPMAERFPRPHLFRTLGDRLAYRKLATSLRRLLTFAFVTKDGEVAFHQKACIQPSIDRFKAYDSLSLLTQPLYDLLGRPGRLKLLSDDRSQL